MCERGKNKERKIDKKKRVKKRERKKGKEKEKEREREGERGRREGVCVWVEDDIHVCTLIHTTHTVQHIQKHTCSRICSPQYIHDHAKAHTHTYRCMHMRTHTY